MKNFLLILISLFCLMPTQELLAQKKKKKAKPYYLGKIQSGFLIDKFIPKGYAGFTYLNLGIRKVTGEKIQESGFETFYYQKDQDKKRVNDFLTTGNRQTGFGLNYYHYIKLKKWDFKKFTVQTGPQFSFGYYHNEILPFTANNFATTYNDFKLGATARVELGYKIDERYSFILGSQYSIFQFGLRRINNQNPVLDRRRQLEDFVQFDFLINRYTFYFGMIRQFGRVKIDRVKLKEKRVKARQKKQEKIDNELLKKQKKKDKAKAKKQKKKDRKQKKKKD